jgi:hypothetical protein
MFLTFSPCHFADSCLCVLGAAFVLFVVLIWNTKVTMNHEEHDEHLTRMNFLIAIAVKTKASQRFADEVIATQR